MRESQVCVYKQSFREAHTSHGAMEWLWLVGSYGVALVSRLLKIKGLFCKRAL